MGQRLPSPGCCVYSEDALGGTRLRKHGVLIIPWWEPKTLSNSPQPCRVFCSGLSHNLSWVSEEGYQFEVPSVKWPCVNRLRLWEYKSISYITVL